MNNIQEKISAYQRNVSTNISKHIFVNSLLNWLFNALLCIEMNVVAGIYERAGWYAFSKYS